jgi:hypothetical protein
LILQLLVVLPESSQMSYTMPSDKTIVIGNGSKVTPFSQGTIHINDSIGNAQIANGVNFSPSCTKTDMIILLENR